MFKIYERYVIKNFIYKFLTISLIFLSLVIILSILEEISFFKDLNESFLYPYFLTLLSAPITLFEIFPFIFLITTQFLFYDLFKKEELNLLKSNGLSNLKIINILFISSMLIGILTIIIYYNAASKLKFLYTDIKNNFSNDNKYLAVVTGSGLWLKDEINNSTLIVKANEIEDNLLIDVIINEFDDDFDLKKTIQSKKIDIEEKKWVINEPLITINNITKKDIDRLEFQTNFDKEKINSLFSNISTLNLLELFSLKKDYEKLGYSSDEIVIHLLKLFSTPLLYGVLTILSSIIMFNFKRNKSLIFHIILGILMSVIIYYINFIFGSLGNNGKIPVIASIFLPILFISIFATMGLIRVNEK
jgi:lipopolysaccharide export system permease protein|tara:strand:+ start:27 stop:1106 length:1080 start_codon:yes stop_codon:yes gene_type:complete